MEKMKNNEYLILVNEHDEIVGREEKIKTHELGLLHRAFSVFIYRETDSGLEILLQQRHQGKYHCGGLWTNSCCSHPRAEEDKDIVFAGQRRLKEEISLNIPLKQIGFFQYKAVFDNGLTEHELDHVLVGEYDEEQEIILNPEEAQDFRWMSIEKLIQALSMDAESYTPWFKPALNLVLKYFVSPETISQKHNVFYSTLIEVLNSDSNNQSIDYSSIEELEKQIESFTEICISIEDCSDEQAIIKTKGIGENLFLAMKQAIFKNLGKPWILSPKKYTSEFHSSQIDRKLTDCLILQNKTQMGAIGIIPDGNRTWAKNKGLPPSFGHFLGFLGGSVSLIEDIFNINNGPNRIFFWLLSPQNTHRAQKELDALALTYEILTRQLIFLASKYGLRIKREGKNNWINQYPSLKLALEEANTATLENTKGEIVLGIEYDGKEQVYEAIYQMIQGASSPKDLSEDEIRKKINDEIADGEIDMIIRTSNTNRINNFKIWNSVGKTIHYHSDLKFPHLADSQKRTQFLEKMLEQYIVSQHTKDGK